MGFSKAAESNAHGYLPDFGAIFMSNSMTRKECMKRRLFGLPSQLGYFVKQIKAGMVLFLFEYEKRLLHGVFQASSDGEMNIVPHAYSSSGKQFPAQVRFSIIWRCKPLSEDQFRNAIRENYFAAKKFHFGLSEDQVRRLLSMFSLRKFKDQPHLRQLSRVSLEHSSDQFIGEDQSIVDDDSFKLNERLRGKRKVGEYQVNTMEESDSLQENQVLYSHVDNRNLTYHSDFQSNGLINMPETLPTREFENDESLRFINASQYSSHELNYSHHPAFPDQNEQHTARHKRSSVPSYEQTSANQELNYCHHPAFPDQNEQNIARQENTEAYYMYVPEKKEFSSQFPIESVKCSSVPTYEQTSANHELDYCHHPAFPDQNEQNIVRQENPEAYYMYVPEKKELSGQLPFDCVKRSGVPPYEQTSANHELNCCHHTAFPDQNEQNIARQENTEAMYGPEKKEFSGQLPFDCVKRSGVPPYEQTSANHELNYCHHPAFPDQNEQNIARQENTGAMYVPEKKEFSGQLPFDIVKRSGVPPYEQTSANHELNYCHHPAFPDQNEQNIERQENTEAYYMHVPQKKEFSSQLPFDSIRLSSVPPYEQSPANHGLDYSHHPSFPDQNEQNIARQENKGAHYAHVSVTKEFPSQLPFDSVQLSSVPPYEPTSANHGPEYHVNSGRMHSDCEKRDSVFSRLSYTADASIQESDDYADHEEYNFDSSLDEVMFALQKYHRQWENTNYEVSNQGHVDGRRWMKEKKPEASLSSFSNCFEISDDLRVNIKDDVQDNVNQVAIGTPFFNFKRRRKTCKVEDDTLSGGHNVITESEQLFGGQHRRRKLIRPSFPKNELRDCGVVKNNVSLDLQDSSKESRIFRERISIDPCGEINETEKIPQSAELPDIIWLDNNEDNIICSRSVEIRIGLGSPRSKSENGKELSNDVPNIAITLSGPDKSCSTDKGSTLKDHIGDGYSLNTNNSGLCNRQESSLEPSEIKTENSIIMVDEVGNKCNEKGLIKSMEVADESSQGTHGTVMENIIKRSCSPDSNSVSFLEDSIDGSKQNSDDQQRFTNEL